RHIDEPERQGSLPDRPHVTSTHRGSIRMPGGCGYSFVMSPGAQVVDVGGRRVRLTNLDKVLYPETGTTKGEVIAYYTAVAPRMLPLLAGRPITRKRWVEGVGTADAPAEAFFAKQLERGAPEWVHRM